MKFNPLGDKLLVRRGEEEETTAGGIVLPGTAAEILDNRIREFLCPPLRGYNLKNITYFNVIFSL